MILGFGLFASVAFLFTWLKGAESNQLYLQPAKANYEYGYFTNENFMITCLTTGDSNSQLTWVGTDENTITATEGRIHVQPSSGPPEGLSLVVESVQKEDAGQYVCRDNRDSVTLNLLVYKSISFGDTPRDQHATEGEDALIVCNVKADTKLPARISFNGLLLTKSDRMEVNENGVSIFNVSRKDAGTYKCNALLTTSSSAQVKEMDINFHVLYMPEFSESMKSVAYASIGALANLSCIVSADPSPMFQWMRNGNAIHNSSDYLILNNETTSILQLTINDESEFGDYLCRASNNHGTEERTVKVEEGNPPMAPELKVLSDGKGTLTVELRSQKDEDNRLRVTGFKVEYVLASETWDQAISQDFKKGEQYILRNLSYNTEYLLRATAQNAAGYGDYSEETQHQTQALQVAPVVSDEASVVKTSLMLMIVGSCILWASY